MPFNSDKKTILGKTDKSKIGRIDKDILPLVNRINRSQYYYTTSSCSGRIVILAKASDKKQDARWLLQKHSSVKFSEAKKALQHLPKEEIWFRQEPPILHAAASSIEHAQSLINSARASGFKRSGIQSTRKRIVMEIASTESMDILIAENGNLLVDDNYLKAIIKHANKKLKNSRKKIKNLNTLI